MSVGPPRRTVPLRRTRPLRPNSPPRCRIKNRNGIAPEKGSNTWCRDVLFRYPVRTHLHLKPVGRDGGRSAGIGGAQLGEYQLPKLRVGGMTSFPAPVERRAQ